MNKPTLGNKFALETVKNHLHKVAFDVFQLDNDPYDGLWKLESSVEDGKDYLVRLDNEEVYKTSWSATSNEDCTSITLAYKNIPIHRFASNDFGFSKDDICLFKKSLLENICQNSNFRNKVLDMQPKDIKAGIIKAFPELSITK